MNKKNNSWRTVSYIIVFLIAAGIIYFISGKSTAKPAIVPLNQVVEEIKNNQVDKVVVNNQAVQVQLKDGKKQVSTKETDQSFAQLMTDAGIKVQDVNLEIKDSSQNSLWIAFLSGVLPILLIAGFIYFMLRSAQAGNSRAMSFGQSKARVFGAGKSKISFADVAGLEEEKQELLEVVDFLKNPNKYKKLGADIPRGVLLIGPPGCGKTLMAKAVAGEAHVPFFSISASEFVEMFVGVGAARVRDLFAKAKRNAPAIIFVDELDAVGRLRGAGLGGGHDEREQTLNQILVEMDGFETGDNVIVMAATNRPDVLDPALLRPGRFDRRVVIDMPDMKARQDIIEVHTKGKPLARDVHFERLARSTAGFSGADLKNLANEAAILAACKNQREIKMIDLENSIEKVLLGPERRSRVLSKEEREITAFHEAGHAVVANALPHCDPVHKVSIISRGIALGYTWNLPEEDKHLKSRSKFEDEIAALIAGRVAEKLIFNEITTGAENDLKRATELARDMVTQYGMSDKLGPATFGEREELTFLGKELAEHKNYSENIASLIDSEVERIIRKGEQEAKEILTKRKNDLKKLAEKLIKEESVDRLTLDKIIGKTTKKIATIM